jgi:predicted nucleotidyltransferase
MNDLVDSRRAAISELCRRFNVKHLDSFGSVVEGNFDPSSSDLDFVVEFELMPPAQHAEAYFSLKEGLEALFGRAVDLVIAGAVHNPFFRERIQATRQRIYAA